MKHAAFFGTYSGILLIIACFLVGGCSSETNESSDNRSEREITGTAQLSIQAGDSLLLSPSRPMAMDESFSLPADLSDSVVVAMAPVEPAQPMDSVRSYRPGSLIHLSLDENLAITARINRNQRIGDNIQSLTGTILNPHTGNIMLSVSRDMLSGTVDVLSANRLFYIRYDRENSRHYLAEINRSKLDIQRNSPPLELN